MNKPQVSITKCQRIHDYKRVRKAVERSLHLIGGLDSLVSPGDRVMVKPNLIAPYHYTTGATTSPHVIRALCELAKEAGARKVTIADGSNVGSKTEEVFTVTGLGELSTKIGVDLINLKKTKTIYMGIPEGKVFRRLKLPEPFMEADVIINAPVMKTHDVFPATLGLKNMKGVLQEKDKKRFHKWGLAQSIVDLNKLALPQVTVLDGTVAMEGMGPAHGTPVNLGVIISSFDTVAADSVAAKVMGIDPLEIEYVKLAFEQGLGCADLSWIEVVGLGIEEVKRPFKRLKLDFGAYREKGIEIYERGACSGCRNTMEAFIADHMESKNRLNLLEGYTLIFGQNVKIPQEYEGKLVNIGLCTRKFREKGGYIPGCPPHPHDLVAFFENK
ncbi:MAG: DUF362 domain-containing protein [bacterium]